MRGKNVLGRVSGFSRIAHSILAGDNADGGELLGHGVVESTFAIAGGNASRLLHQLGDLSFAVDQLGELSRSGLAGAIVVGGDKGHVTLHVESRIKDAYRNSGLHGALDGRD